MNYTKLIQSHDVYNWASLHELKSLKEGKRTHSDLLAVIKYLCLRLNYVRNCCVFPAARNDCKEKKKKHEKRIS